MENRELLKSRIVDATAQILGKKLCSVEYRCFLDEFNDLKDLESSQRYIGGEVYLNFDTDSYCVTWDENAGWNDHFSLYVGASSLFKPDAPMEMLEVSKLSPWGSLIGQVCRQVRVFGEFGSPHILELGFDNDCVYISDGNRERFGDGDDVLIRDQDNMIDLSSWKVMWDSNEAT